MANNRKLKAAVLNSSIANDCTSSTVCALPSFRVEGENPSITIDGVRYNWKGWSGSVLSSRERFIRKNQVRIIGGVIFYAHTIKPRLFRRSQINWIPQGNIDSSWIRGFKAAVFQCRGCDY